MTRRRSGPEVDGRVDRLKLRVTADGRAPGHVRAELRSWLAEREWPVEPGEDVLFAVSEAVSNSAEHAYAGRDRGDEPSLVTVVVSERGALDGRRVEAVISDEGEWRSASQSQRFRGHGLRMIGLLMESIDLDRDDAGTRVRLVSKPVPDRISAPVEGGGQPISAEERLRWLEVVTNTGLAHLTVDRLLNELLDKVRLLMDVDTAAVLLLDPSRTFLIATVARGIEEEVHQGVRIPLGLGFAGRIADERHWVAIEHVDHDNVLNPILREKGIESLLGVPLVAGGTVLGVLHVGTLVHRRFTEQDAELLQLVADRAAVATQWRLSQAELAAAAATQRSLLPARLPEMAGLEFASRYVSGGEGEVGGDWYDVFPLPSGTVCVVVGDVVGHGLQAAQSMSQVRSVLRSESLRAKDPAELLAAVDAYVRAFHPGTLATVMCGMLTPGADSIRLSSAGHPPPILAGAEETITVQLPAGLPLGVELGHPRHTVEVPLPVGSVLCLYSDGLVERRKILVDDNIEQLRRSVTPQAAEAVCVEVMRRLVGFAIPEDDVAVLVLRRVAAGLDAPAVRASAIAAAAAV